MNELNQKLKSLACYDGWVEVPLDMTRFGIQDAVYLARGDKHTGHNALDYHTNISSLYPLAGRVRDELNNNLITQVSADIRREFYTAAKGIEHYNNTFDPAALFDAVYNGIILLNQYKNKNT